MAHTRWRMFSNSSYEDLSVFLGKIGYYSEKSACFKFYKDICSVGVSLLLCPWKFIPDLENVSSLFSYHNDKLVPNSARPIGRP